MRSLRAWLVRLLSLRSLSRRDADFRAELESHIQLHTDDNIRAGMPPAEARRQAMLRIGGVEGLRERHRDRTGVPVVQHLWRDVRYGTRVLRRTPLFSVITIVTLALGIGANTSIFTLVNAALLRPVPYAGADRLVLLWSTDERAGTREISASYPDFESWRDGTQSFEHMAALTSRAVTLGGAEQPELVPAIQTTTAFFRALGVEPIAGRVFTDSDAAAEAPATAVLSDSAWNRQFGGRREVIGSTVLVNGRPHVVIGVVPSRMHFIPTEVEQVYTLLPRETDRRHGYLRVVARLRPGATLESARAELDVIARRTAVAFPETNADAGVSVVALEAAVGAPIREALLILLSIVGAVMLIACSNVASLLLARNASRQHELALRISLGAGRARLIQQLLTESVLLALAGGAAGLLLAPVLTGGLLAVLGDEVPLPRVESIGLDRAVLLFAAAISVVTGLLFGVGPAALSTPRRSIGSIQDAGRSITGSRAGVRARAALVVAETAIALVLLAAAAVLVRGFVELRGTPPGFASDQLLAVGMRLPSALAPGAPRATFFEELRARVESLPDVRSAGLVSNLPMAGGRDTLQFVLNDRPEALPQSANFNIASPGYFRTMRIPVTAGREFSATDNAASPHAIVVNETAARQLWPGGDPLGKQITLRGRPVVMTVVGVTGDVRQSDLGTAPRPEIFMSALQLTPDWPGFALVVHASSQPMSLVADVRASLRAVNADVAIARIGTMDDLIAGRLTQPRVYTTLLGAFALLALILAAVGLYGVIAYSVTQRTRELGVRLALGSTPAALVASIVRHGAMLTSLGITIGLAGAYAATQSISSLLPGTRPGDPWTFVAAAALMLAVGCAAAYIPARRAARVDPLIALRAE
jgi:putative ABC transport system permease protein